MLILNIEQGTSLKRTLQICLLFTSLNGRILAHPMPSQQSERCRSLAGLQGSSPHRRGSWMINQGVEACLITDAVMTTVCYPASCRALPLLPIIQMAHPTARTVLREPETATLQSKWRT